MVDARQFKLELDRFIKDEVPKFAANLQRTIVAETLTVIVQATPVGNATRWANNLERLARGLQPLPKGYVGGQARRNWQVSIGSPARAILPGVDASGATSTSEGYAVIARITTPVQVWISNPLPYMDRLESGKHSKQAPNGMVARAIAAVSAKYARVR